MPETYFPFSYRQLLVYVKIQAEHIAHRTTSFPRRLYYTQTQGKYTGKPSYFHYTCFHRTFSTLDTKCERPARNMQSSTLTIPMIKRNPVYVQCENLNSSWIYSTMHLFQRRDLHDKKNATVLPNARTRFISGIHYTISPQINSFIIHQHAHNHKPF